jgi:hypothetical protein
MTNHNLSESATFINNDPILNKNANLKIDLMIGSKRKSKNYKLGLILLQKSKKLKNNLLEGA